jgi:hypothetical protein
MLGLSRSNYGRVAMRTLAFTGIVGLSAMLVLTSCTATNPPNTSLSSSASPLAKESPKPAAKSVTVASLEIPVTTPPEQVGTAVVKSLSDWDIAGTNDATYEEWMAFSEPDKTTSEVTGDFVYKKAAQYAAIRAEALFGENQADPKIASLIGGWTKNNASFLEDYLITHDDGNVFTYSMSSEPAIIVAQTADSLTLKVIATEHNNAAENRIGSKYDPGAVKLNGAKLEIDMTLKVVNKAYKVSQILLTNSPN